MSVNIVKPNNTWLGSAALILIARNNNNGGGKYKTLMLKRTPQSDFLPGAYVFPGGIMEGTDYAQEWKHILKMEFERFNERLKNIHHNQLHLYNSTMDKPLGAELAFRLCSIRETFEESGILLVRDETGRKHVLTDAAENIGGQHSTLGKWRDKVNEDPACFLKLFSEVKLRPDVSSLYNWSCMLTRTSIVRNHMCFVHDLPHSSEDNVEMVESIWETPQQLLQTRAQELPHPQQSELQRLATCNTFEKLQNFAAIREYEDLQLSCPYSLKTTYLDVEDLRVDTEDRTEDRDTGDTTEKRNIGLLEMEKSVPHVKGLLLVKYSLWCCVFVYYLFRTPPSTPPQQPVDAEKNNEYLDENVS